MADDTSPSTPEQESDAGFSQTAEVVHFMRSEKYQLVYSNFAQCGYTPWDIRLNFGLVGANELGEPTMTEQVSVVFTPGLAKAFVRLLNGNIKNYEKQNGEIQFPKSVIEESARQAAESKAKKEPAPTETQPKE